MNPEELKNGQKYRIVFPAHIKKWMIANNKTYMKLYFVVELEMLKYDSSVVTIIEQVPNKNWYYVYENIFMWPNMFFHDISSISFYGTLKSLIENEARKN